MPEAAASLEAHHTQFRVLLAKEQPAELHDIRIALTGSWVKNGKRFSITKADLSDIVNNFDSRKNGTVVIDYDHASEMPEVARGNPIPAAGWVKGLSVKNGDLIASVQWTEKARELIATGEYRFVSPAIDFEGHDKESGEDVGACLTSVALTNHPFLEELPPLVLSEVGANLADVDSDNVIRVPIPDDAKGQGIKVKVKIEKKPADKDDEKMAEVELGKKPDDVDDNRKDDDEKWMADDEKAVGSGGDVDKSKFAYVGDPDDKSTWKYPIHDASHARNALARWGQHTGIPKDKEPGVLRKIVSAAKRFGVKVDKDNQKYKMAASDAETYGIPTDDTEVGKMAEDTDVKQVRAGDGVGQTDDNKSPYVRDQKDVQKQLAKKDKDRADGERDDNDDECDDAELSEQMAELPLDESGEPPASIPRMKIRRVKSKDSIGKLRHHAVVSNEGKLCGYVTNGDFQTYATRMMDKKEPADPARALSEAIKETTGRPLELSEVTQMVEFAVEHQDEFSATQRRKDAMEKLLSEMFKGGKFDQKSWRTAQRILLSDRKIGLSDREVSLLVIDAEEAVDAVKAAMEEGKVLPLQREGFVRLYLSDLPTYELIMKNATKVIEYGQRGIAGNGEEGMLTPVRELDLKTRQYMKDHPEIDYGSAARVIMHDDPKLAQRYRNEPHKGPVQ